MLSSISARAARKLARLVRMRPARVACPGGIVSFTFDDFPRSALTAGGAILERHGARGTYYAALSLAGRDGELGPMFDGGDLRAAHERGHELACHTYSHLDCGRAETAAILADLARNGSAFADLLDGFAPANFAFPFGGVSLRAKRALAGRFASCRGIGYGLNHGTADLAELAGTRLYADDFDCGRLHALIDRNRELGGWLIFYTHDVAESPSPHGCTPEQFAAVVAYAAGRCEVLPVREVVPRLAAA